LLPFFTHLFFTNLSTNKPRRKRRVLQKPARQQLDMGMTIPPGWIPAVEVGEWSLLPCCASVIHNDALVLQMAKERWWRIFAAQVTSSVYSQTQAQTITLVQSIFPEANCIFGQLPAPLDLHWMLFSATNFWALFVSGTESEQQAIAELLSSTAGPQVYGGLDASPVVASAALSLYGQIAPSFCSRHFGRAQHWRFCGRCGRRKDGS
jgi:hypothetical protein